MRWLEGGQHSLTDSGAEGGRAGCPELFTTLGVTDDLELEVVLPVILPTRLG